MNNQYGPDNLERLGAQLAEQRNRERAIVLDLERRAFSRPEEQRSETQRRLASLIEQAREDAATGRLNAELAREPAAGRVYCAGMDRRDSASGALGWLSRPRARTDRSRPQLSLTASINGPKAPASPAAIRPDRSAFFLKTSALSALTFEGIGTWPASSPCAWAMKHAIA